MRVRWIRDWGDEVNFIYILVKVFNPRLADGEIY